jgi:hypothetical protein
MLKQAQGAFVGMGLGSERVRLCSKGFVIALLALIMADHAAGQAPKLDPPPQQAQPSDRADPNAGPLEEKLMSTFARDSVPLVNGVEKEIRFSAGERKTARVLEYDCPTNGPCRLGYDGRPLRGTYFAWYIHDISWQPGLGWPIFTSYCPVQDHDYRFLFPHHKKFQIVPTFVPVSGTAGTHHFGCNQSGSHRDHASFEVWVWVNDCGGACYRDNAGTYKLTLTGYGGP